MQTNTPPLTGRRQYFETLRLHWGSHFTVIYQASDGDGHATEMKAKEVWRTEQPQVHPEDRPVVLEEEYCLPF